MSGCNHNISVTSVDFLFFAVNHSMYDTLCKGTPDFEVSFERRLLLSSVVVHGSEAQSGLGKSARLAAKDTFHELDRGSYLIPILALR